VYRVGWQWLMPAMLAACGGTALVDHESTSGGGENRVGRCISLCEATYQCEGVSAGGCESDCTQMVSLAQQFGCTTEFDQFLTCGDGIDICDDIDQCFNEIEAYSTCMGERGDDFGGSSGSGSSRGNSGEDDD